ncbi:PDZ domain-containing protein [bacterium]|nr:PDZ domain-containing protein [bacterium]
MRTITGLVAAVALAVLPAVASAGPGQGNAGEGRDGRGYLGIHLQSIDGGLAEALDMKADSGVLVRQVEDESPAAKAGLRAGDIVTKLDGEAMTTPAGLRRAVRAHAVGDEVKLEYLRDGKSASAKVTLAEAEGERTPKAHGLARRFHDDVGRGMHRVRELRVGGDRGFLGVVTQPLTGDLGEYFGVKENEGALVAEVVEDSPAAKLGLKVGDVITSVGDRSIEDPGDLGEAVRSYEEPTKIALTWVRDKKEKRGEVELEVRESKTSWSGDMPFGLGNMRWFGNDDDMRHVEIRRFSDEDSDDLDEELQGVREELDALRTELKELREKVD